jgi:hypothetical protein
MPLTNPCGKLMLRLFDIAFQSRYNLFLIISAGCMAFGVHLQIELDVGGRVEQAHPHPQALAHAQAQAQARALHEEHEE